MVPIFSTIIDMNTKNRKTLEDIFRNPISSSVNWSDVESLFIGLGAQISEGKGSRVRVLLNGVRAVFHRPHPQIETDKGALMSVRKFLEHAGVKSNGL